jgi:hypothetical protein
MTRSRNITEQTGSEQHKTRTDHRAGKLQRARPTRDAGEHLKPSRSHDRHSEVAAPAATAQTIGLTDSAAGSDKWSDAAAVVLIVLGYVAMVVFFVGLAVGF